MTRYRPTADEFLELARHGSLVPVYRQLVGDTLTPVSAFCKIQEGDWAFLFESVVGGERLGRYSFLGSGPFLRFQAFDRRVQIQEVPSGDGARRPAPVQELEHPDPLALLEEKLSAYHAPLVPGLPRFCGGAVGYAGYDTVRYVERLPNPPPDDRQLPDLSFAFYDRMVIFDHITKTIAAVAHARVDPRDPLASYRSACQRLDRLVERLQQGVADLQLTDIAPVGDVSLPYQSNFAPGTYEAAVDKCTEYIRAGDIFQVVLSRRLTTETKARPFDVYRSLRVVNPSPFMFYLKAGPLCLVGASPEIMARVEGDRVTIRPLAGTRRRGKTEDEDDRLAAELIADPKERAEHIMLVDLGRNDVGRVARFGTVQLSDVMTVERYSHVMHICSNVTGRLQEGKTAFDALRACLPAGTLSGAPKVWDARTGHELLTLVGHKAAVDSVAFSPDGTRLASASQDRTVKLWDARAGRELLSLRPPDRRDLAAVRAVTFSPDGERLASGIDDWRVKLWDARTGREVRTLHGQAGPVHSVAFSPDGEWVAGGSDDRTVKLWDARAGWEILTLRGHTAGVRGVVFSPDGRRLASAGADGLVKVWDVPPHREVFTLRGPTNVLQRAPVSIEGHLLQSVAFSPDDKRLAAGTAPGTLKVWAAVTGEETLTLRGPTVVATTVGFSPDGQKLFSQDEKKITLVWDVQTGTHRPALAEAFPPGRAALGSQHPSRPLLALAVLERIELIDLSPPDAFETGYREAMARWDALWHADQARLHEGAKRWFAAAFHWDQLAENHPGSTRYWDQLDAACGKLGDWRPALAVCDRMLLQDPTRTAIWVRRARLHARLFRFHEAAADQHGLAWAQLAGRQKQAFRATCRALYERHRTTKDVDTSCHLAAELGLGLAPGLSCLRGLGRSAAAAFLRSLQRSRNRALVSTACLVADHGLPAEELVRLARWNVDSGRTAEALADLGAAQYRAGQFADAVKSLEEGVNLHGKGGTNWVKLFLAMACHKGGQADRARHWFGCAALPENADWHERLLFDRLRAEAAEMMKRDPNPER